MATTFPGFTPSGFATSQFTYPVLLNYLNSNDRSFLKGLIRKFGTENYGLWQLLMGQTATYEMTDNKQFYHYEKRELHDSLSVANTVAATGAGNNITFLVGSDSYYTNGQCAARVGEEAIIESSGIYVQISAIPVPTLNAVQVTLTPVNNTDNIASVGGISLLAGEIISFRGRIDAGEASTIGNGLAPVYDKIYNTTTEHRDDFTASDFALMEKQEVRTVNGQQYYFPLAMDDMNKRFMNQMFWKVMEANGANNLNNGTYGTIGVQPRVSALGSTIQYAAGNPQISDFQTLGRALNFYGSPGEYHMLYDWYSKQAVSNLLFTTFKQTFLDVSWESVGGSKEAAVAYGFDTYRDSNITYHMTTNPMYNPEMILKRTPLASLGSIYRNYAIAIPQRINQDPKMGESYPSFQIVFQTLNANGNGNGNGGDRVYTWETGGAAPMNKTTTLNRTISMQSYYGVRVIAANQFALFQGK